LEGNITVGVEIFCQYTYDAGHAYFCVHEFKKTGKMEAEILLSNLVFCLFFALLSKYLLVYTEKRPRGGICRSVDAFCLQPESL